MLVERLKVSHLCSCHIICVLTSPDIGIGRESISPSFRIASDIDQDVNVVHDICSQASQVPQASLSGVAGAIREVALIGE
jgi:hypothetical protein